MDLNVSKLELTLEGGFPTQKKVDPDKFLLSQSTMKIHAQWANGPLCGIVYREYLAGNLKQPSSEAAQKGHYFEYLCTGASPAYGDPVPEPERYKRDSNSNESPFRKGDVKGDWIHCIEQSKRFKESCDFYGFKIIASGVRMKNIIASGNLDIIIQVPKERWDDFITTYHVQDFDNVTLNHATQQPSWEQCQWADPLTGQIHSGCIIIDLKYSGLMDDRWSGDGWELNSLADNESTMLQAKQYAWLSGGLPFFFWVFSSTNFDSKLIRVFFDQNALVRHHEQVINTYKAIVNNMKLEAVGATPFTPRPTLKQCGDCPLADGCKVRAKAPLVFGVHVS